MSEIIHGNPVEDFPNKWAILVGVTQYQNVGKLQFCGEDASALATALEKHLKFDPKKILQIHHEADIKPERDHIINWISKKCTEGQIGENDLLIFFFSGHGVINPKDKKDYVLPVNAALGTLEDTGIRVERIIDYLKQSGCNNIVMFIDACREMSSGEKGAKGIASIGDDSREAARRNGIITFFSCNPTDSSYEIEDLKHGAFTYCLLQAIENGKCRTIEDLDKYLQEEVPILNKKKGKPTQQPYLIVEPLIKKDLEIFRFFGGQNVALHSEYESYLEKVSNYYYDEKIDGYFQAKAIEIITRAQKGNLNEPFLRLIRDLVSGVMPPEAFMVTWKVFERGNARSAPIQKPQRASIL